MRTTRLTKKLPERIYPGYTKVLLPGELPTHIPVCHFCGSDDSVGFVSSLVKFVCAKCKAERNLP